MQIEVTTAVLVTVYNVPVEFIQLPSELPDLNLDCINETIFKGSACADPYVECFFATSQDAKKYQEYINSFNLSPEQINNLLTKVIRSCMSTSLSLLDVLIDEEVNVLEGLIPQEKAYLMNLLETTN